LFRGSQPHLIPPHQPEIERYRGASCVIAGSCAGLTGRREKPQLTATIRAARLIVVKGTPGTDSHGIRERFRQALGETA
jgi:hypothetical protein